MHVHQVSFALSRYTKEKERDKKADVCMQTKAAAEERV
jgi:hypothetical protein